MNQTGKSMLAKKVIEELFEYGITFVPETYLRENWGKYVEVIGCDYGNIHHFQDIVVLIPKK
jgi:hypothetical protein